MNLFVFSSNNLTNIWAGIGAQLWAVSKPSARTVQARISASKKMTVGSVGVLYCKETKAFTTPFIVYSKPDIELEVTDVWPEPWILPFRIKTLGTPKKSMWISEMKKLPIFSKSARSNISHVFYIQGLLAFTPSKISELDWQIILESLVD